MHQPLYKQGVDVKKLVLAFMFLCFAYACDSTNPTSETYESVERYFPLNIGNKWEYSYNYSILDEIVEKIVTNNVNHEDGTNLWGFTKTIVVPNSNPSLIVGYNAIKDDGLYYYSSTKDTAYSDSNILCEKELLLKSPIQIGQNWITNNGVISRIAKVYDFNLDGTIYPETVLVIRENDGDIDSMWYALDIGLLKRSIRLSYEQPNSEMIKLELINHYFP